MRRIKRPDPTDSQKPLLDALAPLTGLAYLSAFAKTLSKDLGADFAHVGILTDQDTAMRTVAYVVDGEPAENLSYEIDGTPCAETVNRDFCLYQAMVHASFPSDHFLKDEKIEAYAGMPLFCEDGHTIGAIVALSRTVLEDNCLKVFMQAAAPRVQAELRHHLLQEKMRESLSQSLLLNYSKSMFMANISHELKSPLSAMIGYASLIRDQQVDIKDMQAYAAEICAQGENLLILINDIMSLAMLEIADETSRAERFDLTDIARTGNRMIQHQAAQKHLKVVPASRTDPLFVTGDAAYTKKALMNLLTNAVQFTSLGRIEMEVTKAGDGSARLSVRDSGVGMTEEELARARAPLGDFKNAYDMHQEGAGLGIPITTVLMERQGARLVLESEKGKGTTAHLVFPPELVAEDRDDFI